MIPRLAGHRRVIAPDTLGFGASDTRAQPWSVELFADGVEDLVYAEGLEGFDLVGRRHRSDHEPVARRHAARRFQKPTCCSVDLHAAPPGKSGTVATL
ncbi:alpha/beta fold hydrolase [Kribbella sp. NPDC050470]|uniref:alpha/beta fold hydrolase n=1 Tax=unclassified Kribbella TaxID=2644121 RepID=UPI0037AE47E9